MKNSNEITPLVITNGLDIFQAHDLIDTLSGYKGTEAAIYAIEDWAEENAPAFAIRYANEGNADDAAALLEIYDGDGQDDDNWADVIGAIDKARNAEWLNRSWLEIKSRTIPVAGRDDLRRIERAAAIAGATVSDYGVDDDDDPTDATILAPADKIEILDQLEKHFTAPAEEEPEKIILDADEYDGARLNAIIDCRGYDASATNVYDPRTREETIWVAGKDRAVVIAAYAEDRTTEDFFLEAEVAAWKGNPANEDLDAALEANARDTNNDPNNLYRAGVFAGLAEAAAWMIYGRGICPDDINALTAAVYKAYGVAL